MTGLYILAGLVVVGTIALFTFRAKWAKADRLEEKVRSARLIKEKEEEKVKEDVRAASIDG